MNGKKQFAPAMKRHDASATKTGLVARHRRNLREEFVWNLYFRAPARAFVGGVGAKLAIVRLAAERTPSGVHCFRSGVHFN